MTLTWDHSTDNIGAHIPLCPARVPPMKHTVLRTFSRTFSPLGFLAPFIRMKLLFQAVEDELRLG